MCNGNEQTQVVKVEEKDMELGLTKPKLKRQCCTSTVKQITFALFFTAILIAMAVIIGNFLGLTFLLQLGIVAAVAFVASKGRYKWFYVAICTIRRDLTALVRYIGLLWQTKRFERKNTNVGEIFRYNVSRTPNKVCFLFEGQEWTFAQIEEYSNKVGSVFLNQGFKKGEVVALMMENRPEFVAIWLGLSKIGVVTALINHNLRQTSLVHSISIAAARSVIFDSQFTDAIKDVADQLGARITFYKWSEAAGTDTTAILKENNLNRLISEADITPPFPSEKIGFHDKLVYIYTSGTTGLPKAAVITHSRYVFLCSAISWLSAFRQGDRFYTPLPLYHTAGGCMSIGQVIVFGSSTVIRRKFSAKAYFDDIRRYDCTAAQYIGEMCRYVLAVPPGPDDGRHKLRVIFGNGLRPQIWKEFVERFNIPNVAEFYGATEGNANIVNIDNTPGAVGFVSRIIPSVYPISIIRVDPCSGEPIRNEHGFCTVCKPGEPGVFIGKIFHNNPSRAFLGYVNEKESQKKIIYDVFSKGDSAFISGDLLVSDEFGYLFFKDRTGDTFRWKGENVSTSEVEAVVSNVAGYRDAVVYGALVSGMEGRAGMVAILDHDNTLDLKSLAEGVKKCLPSYARPIFLRILHKLDLTGTYKLKKKDLQEEGFDPSVVKDRMYYLSPTSGVYEPLNKEVFSDISTGKIRL